MLKVLALLPNSLEMKCDVVAKVVSAQKRLIMITRFIIVDILFRVVMIPLANALTQSKCTLYLP